jgi:hypothetical protein
MKTYSPFYFLIAIILCVISASLGERNDIFNKIALGIFILICASSLYLTVYGVINWIKSRKKS